ncbi:methyltransferase domain-containing protein [Proteus mirabilis]|uniref:class I SAM-dependent methyltransferase n=1 Tax=Proteus mirabilis TaxID=584 RepID=UPI00318A8123
MSYLDEYTEAYDEVYTLDNRLMINAYVERVLKIANGDSALDLGLGHGYTVSKLQNKFKRYVVLEGSNKIIDRFQNKFCDHKFNIIKTYFEEYNTEEKYDNIIMGFVLEHVDNPSLILNKYKKFLNNNGSIFIAVPNGESLHRRIGYEAGLLDDMFQLSENDYKVGHKRVFNLQNLREMIESQGYRICREEGIFFKNNYY